MTNKPARSSSKNSAEIITQLRSEIKKIDKEMSATEAIKKNQIELQANKKTLQKQNQQLERDNQDLTKQLKLLKDEVSKAEAQIRLIKDIFFQVNPHHS